MKQFCTDIYIVTPIHFFHSEEVCLHMFPPIG